MISFSCIGCGKAFKVADDLAGRKTRCKKCGTILRIPVPEPVLEPLAPRSIPVSMAEAPAKKRKRKKKSRTPGTIDRDAWVSLGIGLGLAVVALMVPLIGFVIHVLMTVIHELGHTATAWLFASPALPSFDLSYGGGVSMILDRQPVLVVGVYAIFAFFLFQAKDDRRDLLMWTVLTLLYSLAMFSPLRGLLITAMGHGSELVFAGIFLYRALSGSQLLRSEERPLYAFLGLFILLYDARFALNLMSSQAHREAYGEAKGGGHWMDFERIATENLHWPLQNIAALFLIACVLTPAAAFLVHRYGNRSR
jgi:DNA-directed RNA polymerase subunit RPC12/RpoP